MIQMHAMLSVEQQLVKNSKQRQLQITHQFVRVSMLFKYDLLSIDSLLLTINENKFIILISINQSGQMLCFAFFRLLGLRAWLLAQEERNVLWSWSSGGSSTFTIAIHIQIATALDKTFLSPFSNAILRIRQGICLNFFVSLFQPIIMTISPCGHSNS